MFNYSTCRKDNISEIKGPLSVLKESTLSDHAKMDSSSKNKELPHDLLTHKSS